ncbi:MAG: leucine--tRNA ligase [Chloroflexi bacterium]|jgi:leucyl-tRNA synthetase|nr:leucine--tRNA ligase [Chloroflexota bacterium]MBT7080191.1 leucine--tRNA ligase [Chloroflexota bacterium]MBT7290137.1 leucine--tRNA ligase [Chloroflexota bacterium]
MTYDPLQIEPKWQAKWEADGLYKVADDDPRPKWYGLTMFPYTSGDLHVGHWYAMGPSDVHARFKRMQGYNVLHPVGFDAFGLPAENAAIKRSIHPKKWTLDNVDNMRAQLKTMGCCYDWDREIITCLPDYYRWTQWFFLKLYEAGLAYKAKASVNWCPECQTVLANEQVLDNGTCERCNTTVIKKDLEQWFFRITKYAEELLTFDNIDWPERVKLMQKNWIGKSVGTELTFGLEDGRDFTVFTTRPDTVFGVTFVVFAPEHPLVQELTTNGQKVEVEAYIEATKKQTEIERLSSEQEKSGVFTGAYAINKLSGQKVPIWIADYVLMSYGSGAVMAVPAHDTRDYAMAKKYGFKIKTVIAPDGYDGGALEQAYTEPGTMVNSGQFDGQPSTQGKESISDFVESKGWGKRAISYRLRDWLISRQRYWGAPIPMLYCPKCGTVPVPETDLPVLLPEDAEFRPTGESPLTYNDDFVNETCPKCGGVAKRETDTMDTFMCSSWYMYRYASPQYDKGPFDPALLKKWLPVDMYTGGIEHANMHLLYSRFFAKAIRDIGLVDFDEPFTRLFNQGIILHEHQKMSKSRGNVVNPDDYVNTIGADTVRTYLMFIGPWELGGNWDDSGINGMLRWLKRIWNLALEAPAKKASADEKTTKEVRHWTHKTIKIVTNDIERMRFNVMLAALMEFTNYLGKAKNAAFDTDAWREAIEDLILMLAPTTPHFAEELWQRIGKPYSVHNQPFPTYDEKLAAEDEITLIVQINGKVRAKLTAPASIPEDEALEMALSDDNVKVHTNGKTIVKKVYVPGKLVNIVVKG